MVSIRLHWLRVFHWERNQLFNLFAPINFGEEINRSDAKRGSQVTHLCQINPQGTVFDFGNGAARGVMPARKLQLVSKHILRPTALVPPSADQPSDEIPLLHSSTGSMSHASAIFLSSFLDEMALWFIFPYDFTFVVPNSGQNDFAAYFPMCSRYASFILKQIFASVFTRISTA
jgi:hypothetical protein